jgi:Holliday junction resolvasome RuvABC ATP-dependent DNA helicase subunit
LKYQEVFSMKRAVKIGRVRWKSAGESDAWRIGVGLEKLDRDILETMILKFGGGPVGLETLASSIGEDSGTIEDVLEPYLLKTGFITRTPRGRMATPAAYEHLGYEIPGSGE